MRRQYLVVLALAIASTAHAIHRNDPELETSCDPEVIGSAQTVNLHARVSDGRGGVTINFYAGDNWVPLGETQTDSDGDADLEVSMGDFSDEYGEITITAQATGYENDEASLWVINVEVDDVERDDLPDGVPPNTASDSIEIRIDPSVPDGHEITVKITDNDDSAAGSASISSDSAFTESSIFTVTGGTQTAPGHSYGLKVMAYIDDADDEVDSSGGFSVCAHPTNFRDTFYADFSEGSPSVGLTVKDDWSSDGNGSKDQLDETQFKEVVVLDSFDNPPFTSAETGAPSDNWAPGNASFSYDTHLCPRDHILLGRGGNLIYSQWSVFNCARCGCGDVGMPNSGFKIIHSVYKVGTEWKHIAWKEGASAGGVDPGEADDCVSYEHSLP